MAYPGTRCLSRGDLSSLSFNPFFFFTRTLDMITFLSQCMGSSGCYPRGKRAAIVRRYPHVFPCRYTMFSCFHATGCEAYSLRQMDMGSLTCAQIFRACRTHEGGSGTNKSAQELTRGDRKTCPSPCPTRGSNPGSSDLLSQWDCFPMGKLGSLSRRKASCNRGALPTP